MFGNCVFRVSTEKISGSVSIYRLKRHQRDLQGNTGKIQEAYSLLAQKLGHKVGVPWKHNYKFISSTKIKLSSQEVSTVFSCCVIVPSKSSVVYSKSEDAV